MLPQSLGKPDERPSLVKRLLWFAALWIAGVVAISIVGLAIKLMLRG